MKLTNQRWLAAASWLGACAVGMLTSVMGSAQKVTTTTVQGTVYLANGLPGSGTLQLSWPAFTTASNQAITAGRLSETIGADGYLSVNLAPNQGSTPVGLYYTAVYHLSDGTTSTEYWTVPSAAQASLSQVRAQVMPAAQAVQAVSKSYVDQSIAELTQSLLTASGGSLSGPLFLSGDPTQPTQAATKHYVDDEFGMAVPLTGAAMSGPLTSIQLGAAYQVDQFPGADFGAKLQACVNELNAVYGGTCDARNFSGTQAMTSPVVIATANATVQLPCATITMASPIQITAGTRNVTLHGCALRGASTASGSEGGTVFLYSGSGPAIEVGDSTYAMDTPGFHLDGAVINTTASTNSGAQGLAAYRTQELDLESLYLLGNSNQTGITLDGTGNYTGGTFQDIELGGFGTGLSAIGHQVTNAATTDWLNASTFIRLHIDCPTSGGSPVAGTYGINLLQGDGNTFTGGDVEGCATALHLGPNAQNNTIVGLRNENSSNQVVADAGSSYNSWMTGGTMFTGQLTDNGTRNSFLDTFHRSFNSLNGDWYGSQKDATVTNHFRIGTGAGNERGLLNRYESDYGYRWTTGLSDATAGEQFYQVQDELNNVYRLSIGQYNYGQASTNNQTVINAAGSGAVVLNGSANSGTGGVIFGAGGSSGAPVATINNAGNAQFNGTLQVSGPSTFTSTTTVKNQADGEIDSVLWAGASANQKESFIYKDYTGASQWYMVNDKRNNWALNSAPGGLDSFKAYQSNNSGDTYINASNGTGHIRLNYETGAGTETDIYSGSSSALVAAFLGSTAIKFPGLASASGHNCMQIDNSGYISNTGAACGSGAGVNGTVNAGSSGQVAYYDGDGTVIAGTSSVAVNAGGTGATTAAQALLNLGAQPAMPGISSDGASGVLISGNAAANRTAASAPPVLDITHPSFGAIIDGTYNHPIDSAIQAAANALPTGGGEIRLPCSPNFCYWQNPNTFVPPNPLYGQIIIRYSGTIRLGTTLSAANFGSLILISEGGAGGVQFQSPGEIASISIWPPTGNGTGTLGTQIPVTTLSASMASGSCTASITDPAQPFQNGQTISIVGASSNGGAAYVLPTVIQSGAGTGTLTVSPCASRAAAPGALVGSVTTFTPSNMTGIAAGSAITIGGTTACSISTVSRGSNGVTTAQLTGYCPIPINTPVTVAGVADSGFNGTYTGGTSGTGNFMTIAMDRVNNTISWGETGAAGSSTGGTITGFNEDTLENVQITATTSTTATATFYRQHAAADGWGVVGIDLNASGATALLQDVTVSAGGTGIWLQQAYKPILRNVGVSSQQQCSGKFYNWPIESGFTGYMEFDRVALSAGCAPWSYRATTPYYNANSGGGGPTYITRSFIYRGIKLDHGGCCISMKDTVIEQASGGVIQIDPTNFWNNAYGNKIHIEYSQTQDIQNVNPSCWIYQYNPFGLGPNVTLNHVAFSPCLVSNYFTGRIKTENPDMNGESFDWGNPRGIVGTFDDGTSIEGDVRSAGVQAGAVTIPHATVNVTTNPASWPSSGGAGLCTVTTGINGPWSTGDAGQLTTASGSGSIGVGSWTGVPQVGDAIIFGGNIYSPTPGMIAAGGGTGSAFNLNFTSAHVQLNSTPAYQALNTSPTTNQYDSQIADDWWHSVRGVAFVTQTDGTSTTISLNENCRSDRTLNYWSPFMVYIPASEARSLAEIYQWRTQYFKGYVPPGVPAGIYSGYPINLVADPTSNLQAATKHYVDAHSGYTLPPATTSTLGGVMPDGISITVDSSGRLAASSGGGTATATGTVNAAGDGTCFNNTAAGSPVLYDCGTSPRPFPQVFYNATGSKQPPAVVENIYPTSTTGSMGFLSNCASSSGSIASSSTTAPMVARLTSGATSGNCAGWYSAVTEYSAGRSPMVTVGFSFTASTDYSSSARVQLGLIGSSCSQATLIGSDTPACGYAVIRHSTSASDSNYQCVSDTGSGTPQVTDIGVGPSASYTVASVTVTSTNVTCTVNGTSVTNSTKVPTGNLYGNWTNTTLTNAATHLQVRNIYGVDLAGTY